MDTEEIFHCLQKHPKTKKMFLGVFSSNNIPVKFFKMQKPVALVYNFDPVGQPGSHWVALYSNGKRSLEYFDSYGLPPIHSFMFPSYKVIKYNKKRLQGQSQVCGLYCIYYILEKARNKSIKQIVKSFDPRNFCINDSYVKATVCDLCRNTEIQLCFKDGVNSCNVKDKN